MEYTMELYEGLEHRFPKEMDERALDSAFLWMTTKRKAMLQKNEQLESNKQN
ncbi:hypothetical protein D3C80_2090880 [compost metagenome]